MSSTQRRLDINFQSSCWMRLELILSLCLTPCIHLGYCMSEILQHWNKLLARSPRSRVCMLFPNRGTGTRVSKYTENPRLLIVRMGYWNPQIRPSAIGNTICTLPLTIKHPPELIEGRFPSAPCCCIRPSRPASYAAPAEQGLLDDHGLTTTSSHRHCLCNRCCDNRGCVSEA